MTAGPAAAAIVAAIAATFAPNILVAGLGVAAAAAVGAAVSGALGAGVTDPRLARRLLARVRRAPRPAPPPPPLDEVAAASDLLDSLPVALALLDARGEVVFANAAMRQDLERDPTGEPFAASHRAPQLLAAVRQAVQTGAAATATFSTRRRQIRSLLAIVRPISRTNSDAVQVRSPSASLIVVMIDETRARVAERVHRDFVANASHELKTPLASITGFIETLRGPARDDAAARERFLGIMADQAARMGRLVEDLLSLNRIELNEHLPPQERVDLAAVIEDAAASAAHAGAVDLELPAELPPVLGDRAELTQVFANLIDNALKYGGGARAPLVTAHRLDPAPRAAAPAFAAATSDPAGDAPGLSDDGAGPAMVSVTVTDFGPGIAKQHLSRLTERFYRVDGGPAAGAGGTGLGLAIVKHVLSRHRGDLRIDSRLGRGSRFTVRLPCAPARADETPERVREPGAVTEA